VQGIKLGLDTIRAALIALGEPQARYPSLLVAGTNGKGSTVAMASGILCAMGQRVGSTVSPHLTEYRERFLIDGVPIAQSDLQALGERVARVLDADAASEAITFFEIGVALSLAWFAEQKVDSAVIEVGMGGEFDATRACVPLVAGLVSIDEDHLKHLGPTLADVARTKARVAPPGGVLVVGEAREDRLGPVFTEAQAVGCAVWLCGRDFSLTGADGDLTYRSATLVVPEIALGLAGAHQRGNAATAVAVVQAFCAARGEPGPTPDEVRRGLRTAFIAGRLEALALTPGGASVLLDGAHNPAGAVALGAELARGARPARRVWLYAAMGDKDRGPILDAVGPHVDEVWCTRGTSTPRFADPELLASEARDRGLPARCFSSPAAAVAEARRELTADDQLLVAGSLYLVGDVRPLILARIGQRTPAVSG